MAEETRVARTSSISGIFHVGDLTVTPEGTELTKKQWITVRDAAFANGVRVGLDEEFPPEPLETDAEDEKPEQAETEAEAPKNNPSPAPVNTGRTPNRKG